MNVWCAAVIDGTGLRQRVRFTTSADGTVERVEVGRDPAPDDLVLGTVMAGAANAHSHAFHRALRGRTHGDGGDFWAWRNTMYEVAALLTPENYYELASAVFAEMVVAGYTAVGEFHYVHHRPDGTPYPHQMELAVAAAAASVGIRLTLLDTAYLAGGVGRPLGHEQKRFGDRTADGYLERWYELNESVDRLGAAIHSVRAVPPEAIERIVAGLPGATPLHIHVSEQPQENADAAAAYGRTPTQLLADLGVLGSRLSAVHATHLIADDVRLLGDAGASIVVCPTTEADLGDGIGPARLLKDAGARLALGSDQNAVVDPFLEMRGLEMHERLASGHRGRFTPGEVVDAASAGGYRSLGWHTPPLHVGGPCDLVEVRTDSVRTVGSDPLQLAFAATAADVARVLVAGRVVADRGMLANGDDPADLIARALEAFS